MPAVNGMQPVCVWAKECSTIPAKVIATCFALASFAATLFIGMAVGNSSETTLKRAIGVMLVCWFIGAVVGRVMQRSIDEHIERYKQAHPIVDDYDPEASEANVAGLAAAKTRPRVDESAPHSA